MADRCGPLCQHPGCWHAGKKVDVYSKRNAGYLKFMKALLSKSNHSPPQEKAVPKECDGLPVVTVFDAAEQAALSYSHPPKNLKYLSKLTHSCKQGDSLSQSWSSDLDTAGRDPVFNIRERDGLHCLQLVLEQMPENSQPQRADDELEFTPVFIWKPGAQSQRSVKKFDVPFEWSSGRGGRTEEKIVALTKTDLTESLPREPSSYNEGKHRDHSYQQWLRGRREGGSTKTISGRRRKTASYDNRHPLEQILMEDLSDMPTHIVKQIIQHLRSESDVLNNSPPSPVAEYITPHSPSPPLPLQPLIRSPESKVPASVLLNLSTSTVHRPRPQHYQTTRSMPPKSKVSFSRRLATNPEEAMHNLKIRRPILQQHQLQHPQLRPTSYARTGLSTRQSAFSEATTIPTLPPHSPPLQRNEPLPTFQAIGDTLFPPRQSNNPPSPRTSTHLKRQQAAAKTMKQHALTHELQNQPWLSISSCAGSSQPHSNHFSVHLPSHTEASSNQRYYGEDYAPTPKSESRYSGVQSSLSHHSSDHLIASADIATETGELLLLDRRGRVIHYVKEGEQDTHWADDNDSGLEDGSIAPPPTARYHTNQDKEDDSPDVP